MSVLQVVAVADGSVNELIRETAAVYFKNWVVQSYDTAAEKEQIKDLTISIMAAAGGKSPTPRIHSNISEALTCIAEHDFPKAWPNLLDELLLKMDTFRNEGNFDSFNGVLATINSLFKKFRRQLTSKDLEDCVRKVSVQLLNVFKWAMVTINGPRPGSDIGDYMECASLCCGVFYSINYHCVHERFNHEMEVLCDGFIIGLKTRCMNDRLYLLQSSICECIILLLEKGEKSFLNSLRELPNVVFRLLKEILNMVDMNFEREKVIIDGLKVMISISSCDMFSDHDILKSIIECIVIPSVNLGRTDVDLFQTNHVKFIQKYMEANNRRSIACELLKALAVNYKKEVFDIFYNNSNKFLDSFAADPLKNWVLKDLLLYICAYLATEREGGNSISTHLNDDFLLKHLIFPEIFSANIEEFPIMKAGALKACTMLSNKIVRTDVVKLLPYISRFLDSKWNVVHSYAAICIEKLVEDGDVDPSFLLELMSKLFCGLNLPESEDNLFVMKCIKRLLQVSSLSRDVALPCMNALMNVLDRVCEDPICPLFHDSLFESMVLLIRRACEQDPFVIVDVEGTLLANLQRIVSKCVTELFPCTCQLLAQLVDLNQTHFHGQYIDILEQLPSDSWKKPTPEFVHFLHALLRKAPQEMIKHLYTIIELAKTLLIYPRTVEQGFYLLNLLTNLFDYGVISQYKTRIWDILLEQLRCDGTNKYIKCVVIFMSIFLVKHAPEPLSWSMIGLQPEGLDMILKSHWIPTLNLFTGSTKMKLVSMASTKLLCEWLTPSNDLSFCPKMLENIWTLNKRLGNMMDVDPEVRMEVDPEVTDMKEEDLQTYICTDVMQYLIDSLARHSALTPGKYPRMIGDLPQEVQVELTELFKAYTLHIT